MISIADACTATLSVAQRRTKGDFVKRLASVLLAAAIAVGVMAVPTAAQAQSGGGCLQQRLSPCSSYSNSYGRQSGDFYVNSWGSECTAQVYLRTNGVRVYHYTAVIDHLGRYPEVHKYITSTGSGRTEVEFFTCSGSSLGWKYSPYIYFP